MDAIQCDAMGCDAQKKNGSDVSFRFPSDRILLSRRPAQFVGQSVNQSVDQPASQPLYSFSSDIVYDVL